MPIFDTHCHYNLEPLFNEQGSWQDHWQRAQERGVTHSAVVGTNVETSLRATEIAAKEKNLFATVGIHPSEWMWQDKTEFVAQQTQMISSLTTKPKVIAIGETGLDYFWTDKEDPTFKVIRENQLQALRHQLEIAINNSLPAILHVRDKDITESPTENNAYWDIIAVLKEVWPTGKPFILHCVSGPLAYLQEALKLGAYVGVAGNVTYPSAEHLRNLVRTTPSDKILLETDAPYLAPVPHRGKSCEPHMIADTEKYLREVMGIDTTLVYHQSLGLLT